MDLSREEWDALGQLPGHPGWVVFSRLVTSKIDELIGDLANLPVQSEEKVYAKYLRWRALVELKNDVMTIPVDAAKNRFAPPVE